jgi:hypothetical protein
MTKKTLGHVYPVFFLLLTCLPGKAQNNPQEDQELPFYRHQLELHHDNDFLLFTDWYYTTGSFISYKTRLDDGKDLSDMRQWEVGLTQYYFTPSAIKETLIALFDRPYAGYLGLYTKMGFWNQRRLLDFTLDIGVTGPASGAEGFQRWFHSSGESANPRWVGQIDNGVHANLRVQYTREWKWLPNPFSVYASWKPAIAVGSKDIYLEQGALFTFGKRSGLENSMAHGRIGEIVPELFFGVHFTYRYVLYDAMLEGYIIGDNSVYTVDPVDHLFFYGLEGNYRKKRMEYRLGYTFASPRAPQTTLHTWVKISIARNF